MTNNNNSIKHFEELFLANSKDVLYYMHLSSGEYSYITDSCISLFGYTAQEFYNSPFLIKKLIHNDFKNYFDDMWQKLLKGTANSTFEYKIISKTKEVKWLNQRNHLVYDNKQNIVGIKAIVSDITYYKNLQEDLQNSKKKFTKLLDFSSDWVWEIDSDGIFTFVSDKVKDFLGYDVDEMICKTAFDTMPKDEAQRVAKIFNNLLKSKKSFRDLENINIHKDGHLVTLQTSGFPFYDKDSNFMGYRGTAKDVSQRVEKEKELEIASSVFKHSSEGIVITDKNNKILSVNNSFEKLTGYTKEEVLGKDPKMLSSGWGDKEFYKKMWHDLLTEDFWASELWDRKKDGTLYAVEQSIICVRDKNNEIVNYIAISHDITEAKNKEDKIHQLAFYDFLTKLPNAKLFQQEVETYLKSSHYNSETFAILFLDLDNFKWVNDSLGHYVGDQLLVEMAAKLKSIISQDSILARLGGDEFVILTPYENLLSISQFANAILATVKEPIKLQDKEVNVGWSIGISLYPQNGENYSDLLKNADAAMYEAKDKGKSTFRYFNDAMNQDAIYRLDLDTKLRHAIANNSFFLNYQPKYSYTHKKTIGVEALIRWIDKDLGFVPPDKFIPIAEESNYINKIGNWVIKQALYDLKIINSKLKFPISIAINISGKQLDDGDFYDEVKKLIHESGVEPSLIEFEITETSIMQNIQSVIEILKKIKKLGVKISVDDFGTGYSSMSYLKKLPIDTLKIDREFVKELESDADSKSIVSAIMALAKSLSLTTVAEGVENEEQKDILDKAECDMLQGYLYSKPLSLDDLLEFLD